MGRLTTHVLDTAQGIPAEGVRIMLERISGPDQETVGAAVTNREGRVDQPLLEGDAFVAGTYELAFDVDDYFQRQPVAVANPAFLDIVTIRFTVNDADSHYHVPLLVSPWAYSTYRGS